MNTDHRASAWCERVSSSEAEAVLEICLAMNVNQPAELRGSGEQA